MTDIILYYTANGWYTINVNTESSVKTVLHTKDKYKLKMFIDLNGWKFEKLLHRSKPNTNEYKYYRVKLVSK